MAADLQEYPSFVIERDSKLHKLMKQIITERPLYSAINNLSPLTNQKGSVTRQIAEMVEASLTSYGKACSHLKWACDGSHLTWCVAGGYATYLAGNTATFRDIDIYVSCNRKF